MNKVIIGIVAKHRNLEGNRLLTTISDEVKNAVFENGGIAIGILPTQNQMELIEEGKTYVADKILNKKDKENLIEQIRLCNGIILQGGILSDTFEIFVAKYCYENNIPLLAICAGQNNMVRALGGTVKMVKNPEFHLQPNKEIVHSINIDKKSNFYKIVKTEKLIVNSRHKRVVDNVGGLNVSAKDEEDNIEVVEASNKRFFLGVRFHPESLCKNYKEHDAIFKAFINACKI